MYNSNIVTLNSCYWKMCHSYWGGLDPLVTISSSSPSVYRNRSNTFALISYVYVYQVLPYYEILMKKFKSDFIFEWVCMPWLYLYVPISPVWPVNLSSIWLVSWLALISTIYVSYTTMNNEAGKQWDLIWFSHRNYTGSWLLNDHINQPQINTSIK